MNERIKELADKIWAEEYWTNSNTDKLLPAQLNKFAELIVKECMDLVASRPYIDDGNWSHPSMMIKQHFGVEE